MSNLPALPILERLSTKNVLDVDLDDPENKTVGLTEACDWYYTVRLTKSELWQLGMELMEISRSMSE